MSNFVSDIRHILIKYPEAYITDSKERSWQEQARYLLTRSNEYVTSKEFMVKFKLDKNTIPKSLNNCTEEQKEWLRDRILEISRNMKGFYHVGGFAVDISVKNLSLDAKFRLKNVLVENNYRLILEFFHLDSDKIRYNVPIKKANVFHVDLKHRINKNSVKTIAEMKIRKRTNYQIEQCIITKSKFSHYP